MTEARVDQQPPSTELSSPHHRFSVRGRLGCVRYDVSARLAEPWTVIFGASGSGKSTVLRSLAGLVKGPEITFHRDRSSHTQELQDLPPESRRIAYAPQQAVLFPHLSVDQNIRFALDVRARKTAGIELGREVVNLLELGPLLGRKPGELSGGERQRVSLARALAVPDALLLLLDEPFAGVDRALRDDLLPRVQQFCAGRHLAVLSVTHDVDEALLLGAQVLRLHEGRVQAQGPASVVLAPEVERLARIVQRATARPLL